MKKKTPKTIADLKINWTFCKGEGNTPIPESKVFFLFQELNSSIYDLIIKKDRYVVKYQNEEFVIHSLDNESVCSFMSYLNWLVWDSFEKTFKLKKFVRVSDTEYVLYGE